MNLPPPTAHILNKASAFLDFDGTLVELGPTREEIVIPATLRQLLARLHDDLGGRLAVLSGRPPSDVRSRIGSLNIAIGGNSRGAGFSRGGRAKQERSFGLTVAARELRRFEAETPGVAIEEQAAGLAIHYGRSPNAEPVCRNIAQRLATATGMVIHYGKTMIELKSRSTDKGRTVRLFMRRRPFRGTVPVVVADDVTYEHAFVVARDMGGCGVLVGPERSTAAQYRLENVAAVHRWLAAAGGRA